MTEKQISVENPDNQHELQEQQARSVESFEDAMIYTANLIGDFRLLHNNGINVEGGAVTPESLQAGVKELIKEVESEETDPNLEQFVTQLARVSSESERYSGDYTQNPMIAFLISRGAYEQHRRPNYSEPNKAQKDESRRKSLGHQIIADGHVVRGHIVPGVGVKTDKGILRTRGTPRLWNR